MNRSRMCRLLLLAVTLSGCAGEQGQLADGEIAGFVFMSGPVEGAVVRVYQLSDFGGVKGKLLGESEPSLADGSFQVDASVGLRSLLLEVEGSQVEASGIRPAYHELANNEEITLDDGDILLKALIPDFQVDQIREHVVISPITTMAAEHAAVRMDETESTRVTAKQSLKHVSDHFGGVQLLQTVPNTSFEEGAKFDEQIVYGIMLASLSHLAQKIAVVSGGSANTMNSLEISRLLTEDLRDKDGLFDGRGRNGALIVSGCQRPSGCEGDDCKTICNLDANTPRSDFATSILSFVRNSKNQAVETADVLALVEEIRTNSDPDLFPTDAAPEDLDQGLAEIRFDEPTEKHISGDLVVFQASVANDQLGTFSIRFEGIPTEAIISSDENPTDAVVRVVADPSKMPPGPLRVTAIATDENGTSILGKNFIVDDGSPSLGFQAPAADLSTCKPFKVEATASDNALDNFSLVLPNGVNAKDEDSEPSRIVAHVPVDGLPDGPLVIKVVAVDKNGQTTQAERVVSIDCTAPTFVSAQLGVEELKTDGDAPVVPTAEQKLSAVFFETNGVEHFSLVINGKSMANLPALQGADGSWRFDTTITLESNDKKFRENLVEVTAVDTAGNRSETHVILVKLDNGDPTIQVLSSLIDDETQYLAAFREDFRPCLFVDSDGTTSPEPIDLRYDVNATEAGSAPTVLKYGIHYRSLTECVEGAFIDNPLVGNKKDTWKPVEGGNPLSWNLLLEDNSGVVPSLTYRVVAPGQAPSEIFEADIVESTESKSTHRITLTDAEHATLSSLSGEWAIELVAKDEAGREGKPLQPIRFNNEVMAGPLFFERVDPSLKPAGEVLTAAKMVWGGGTQELTEKKVADLFAPFGGKGRVALEMYRVRNGTKTDGRLKLKPNVSAKATRQFGIKRRELEEKQEGQKFAACSSWFPFSKPSNCDGKSFNDLVHAVKPSAILFEGDNETVFDLDVQARLLLNNGAEAPMDGEFAVVPGIDNKVAGSSFIVVDTAPWTFLWSNALPAKPTSHKGVATGAAIFGRSGISGSREQKDVGPPGEPIFKFFGRKIQRDVFLKEFSFVLEPVKQQNSLVLELDSLGEDEKSASKKQKLEIVVETRLQGE